MAEAEAENDDVDDGEGGTLLWTMLLCGLSSCCNGMEGGVPGTGPPFGEGVAWTVAATAKLVAARSDDGDEGTDPLGDGSDLAEPIAIAD